MENLIRCVVSVVLAAAGNHHPAAYGLALVAGYVTAFIWPWTLRMTLHGDDHESPLVLLGGASGGQLLGQVALTGGPVLLALAGGGPAEVTVLFAGLALFRAPYTLAIGMVAQLTARFTTLVVERRSDALHRLRTRLVVAAAVLAVLAAPVGAWVGRPLLPLVFGDDVRMSGRLCAVLAAASTLAIASLVVDAAADRPRPDRRSGARLAAGRGAGCGVLRILAGAGARPHVLGVPRRGGRGVGLDGGRGDPRDRPPRGGVTVSRRRPASPGRSSRRCAPAARR